MTEIDEQLINWVCSETSKEYSLSEQEQQQLLENTRNHILHPVNKLIIPSFEISESKSELSNFRKAEIHAFDLYLHFESEFDWLFGG